MSLMDEFLDRPFLARMATADPATHQPHVVPVWYAWDGKTLWISAFRSTRKVRELVRNPRISVVIDVDASANPPPGISAVLMEGKAEFFTQPRSEMEQKTEWIYRRYLGEEGVKAEEPQSWIRDPEALLIKLTPRFTKTWA